MTPPRDVQHPARLYVTDYGKHSSLVLPNPQGGYSEFAYGDYDFFALGHNQIWHGPQALLASRGATLGRRKLPDLANAVDALRLTGAKAVIDLSVDGSRAEALRQSLEVRYSAAGIEPHYNPVARLYFVPDAEKYHLFHTCNHAMREWLEELGCDVDGNAWGSQFVVKRP